MKKWLDIPEKTLRQHHLLDAGQIAQLERLLAFITRDQDATMDHLIEEVMSTYMRRRARSFPVPDRQEKFAFALPKSLQESLEERLRERQEEVPEATMNDLIRHAIDTYLASRTGLMKAWKEWEHTHGQALQEEMQKSDGEPAEPLTRELPAEAGEMKSKKDEIIESIREKHRLHAASLEELAQKRETSPPNESL